MGKIPRLSRNGEIELSLRIEAARRNYRLKILESPLGALQAIGVLENIQHTHGPGEGALEDTTAIDPDRPGILERLPHLIGSLRARMDQAYELHERALEAGLATETRRRLGDQVRKHQQEWAHVLEELHFHPKKLRPCVEQLEGLARSIESLEGGRRGRRAGQIAPSHDSVSEELSRITLLTMESPTEVVARVIEIKRLLRDYEQAKQELCCANLRLVVSLAAKYKNLGLPLPDLIQEGNAALMKAAEKFRPLKGCKFSTYSAWWIRQGFTRAIDDQVRPIRLPANMRVALRAYHASIRGIIQRLGREPSAAEKMTCSSLPFEETRRLLRITREIISLEAPLSPGRSGGLGDLLEDRELADPGHAVQRQDMNEHVARRLDRLPPREREIIKLRFGIGSSRASTLGEVGSRFNLSRERVRQIEASVIEKLRRASWFKELELFSEAAGE